MPDQKLIDYVVQCRQSGTMTDEEIRQALLAAGWNPVDVSAVLPPATFPTAPRTANFSEPSTASSQISSYAPNENIAISSTPVVSENVKKTKLVAISLSGLVVLAVLIGGGIFFTQKNTSKNVQNQLQASSTAAAIQGEDLLKIDDVSIPESENAYFDILKLKDELVLDDATSVYYKTHFNDRNYKYPGKSVLRDYVAGTSISKEAEAYMLHILELNERSFQISQIAAAKPYFYFSAGDQLTFLAPVQKIAKLNSVRADQLLKNGNINAAAGIAFDNISLGQKMQDGSPVLISYLVGSEIKRIGLERLAAMASSSKVSAETKSSWLEKLQMYKDNRGGLIKTMQRTYKYQNSYLETFDSNELEFINRVSSTASFPEEVSYAEELLKVKSSSTFKLNETRKLLTDFYLAEIENIKKGCDEDHASTTVDFNFTSSDPLSPGGQNIDNYVGKLMYSGLAIGGMYRGMCNIEAKTSEVEAVLNKK